MMLLVLAAVFKLLLIVIVITSLVHARVTLLQNIALALCMRFSYISSLRAVARAVAIGLIAKNHLNSCVLSFLV